MTTYWSKPVPVDAIRLTEDNLQAVADYLGGVVFRVGNGGPYIQYRGDAGCPGEWIVCDKGVWKFYTDTDFQERFRTHSQRLAEDEKYANIFQIVTYALQRQAKATFNQNSEGEMDLVAIETVQRIMGEL
jgi:hypothetical protein